MEILKRKISKLFFITYSLISGLGFMTKLHFLKKMEQEKVETVQSIQLLFLKEIINEAYRNCPYYREKMELSGIKPEDINTINDIQKLPPTTKNDFRERYLDMVNSKFNIKSLKKTTSSGSTGEPKTFFFDKQAAGWRLACVYFLWQRAGFNLGEKHIRISPIKRDYLKSKIRNILSRCRYIGLDLYDSTNLENASNLINEVEPKMIGSMSMSLFILTEYNTHEKKIFTNVPIITTSGSILFPHQRELIEHFFNTKVLDLYGGDGMSISGQCQHGSYHINDPSILLEVVDDNYQPQKSGVFGRILVTDLHNKAMPHIRYEIGDLGMLLDEKCACGSSYKIMAQPLGRDTDIIKLSNGVNLMVHQFSILLKEFQEVIQFQVRETDIDTIRILLVVKHEYNDEIQEKILEKIDYYSKRQARVSIDIVEDIPLERGNKRRYMIGRG